MAKLFDWRNTASHVKSRRAVLSRPPRLTWPYFLDDGAMSSLGEHGLADGRIDEGGWCISPPGHSGGESDRSCAGKAQARFLAVRVPAGWQRPHSLCHAGPASGAGRRRPVRRLGAFWSGWFWGVCSMLRSRRDRWPGSDPALCRASFLSRPILGRCPRWDHLPSICRGLVGGGVRALAPGGPPLEPTAVLVRLLFVLDVRAHGFWWRLPVAALGGGQRLRVTGCGPLTLVGTPLAEALQVVSGCPYGPAA